MLRSFEKEETALRRRLLFRLLRRFDFDRPQMRGEMISAPVPESLMASDYAGAGRGAARFI